MNKINILLMILIFSNSISNAQPWKTIIINDEVSVNFPSLPIKKEIQGKEMYFYRAEDYALMVGVAIKVFSDSSSQLKQQNSGEIKPADTFLSQVINGKIAHGNQILLSTKTVKIGNHIGKEIAYLTSDSKERFCFLLLTKDTLYTFECWYLKKNIKPNEKETFFNSILVKE
ncbi:hypothetical protein [Pedobacter sp. FW305-3-2-15-E-R2A2]|uniref:hypothetical protein n=1 Tax=Pedobacter sp. FW305-3-2-15-E-R2A2 TaxID=3140251 RepID=UPI0031409460